MLVTPHATPYATLLARSPPLTTRTHKLEYLYAHQPASTTASTMTTVRATTRLLKRAASTRPTSRQIPIPSVRWSSTATPSMPRMYRYYVDIHGQMFLYDTEPKNLTSCFKDARFLNFFYDRLCASPVTSPNTTLPTHIPSDWHENPSMQWEDSTQAVALANTQGYKWISYCGKEWNFVKTAEYGTPVVFKECSVDRMDSLTWAGGGDRIVQLQPDRLRVCGKSGYLYHPSPLPHSSKYTRNPDTPSPYGPYSLLSSQLVLQHFADGLDMRADGQGGSVQWRGARYDVLPLREGDVV